MNDSYPVLNIADGATTLADLLAPVFLGGQHPTGDHPALIFEDQTLSYSDLIARVVPLITELRAMGVEPRGVEPEVLVGVYAERSVDMVVALLAIVLAGGAFVPLEPSLPPERLAFLIRDAAPKVIVAPVEHTDSIPESAAAIVAIPTTPASDLTVSAPQVSPTHLAYVMYTSGSTGQPKGVLSTHAGIANRLLWVQEVIPIGPGDRVLQKTPITFDVSLGEIFWPFITGATLVVARPGGHRDPAYLADTIERHGVTVTHFVPSMLELFLDQPHLRSRTDSLRYLLSSGEALTPRLRDRALAEIDAELHNLYGPTEASVEVTHWRCQSGEPTVPIGRPGRNNEIHVLDDELRPVPGGTVGELCIGGIQVARGYLNQPELTRHAFVLNPGDGGGLLYRTGDRARQREDGVFEYLGRADDQVKVRGVRVELGEIEHTLERHDAIRQAVVTAKHETQGETPCETQLVAYYTVQHPVTDGELRAHLARWLPEPMHPQWWIPLEEIPLTPSGKTDRNALPAPGRERPSLEQAFVRPEGPLEEHLARLWGRVLEIDTVGRNDRFFELGGTSLGAARVVGTLKEELGESLYVVSMFNAPTVAEYGMFLEREYRAALRDRLGISLEPAAGAETIRSRRIDAAALNAMKKIVPRRAPGPSTGLEFSTEHGSPVGARNPRAIFVLAPPRSGTTLLRVMLAGHPGLFAASELQLLGFETLNERAAAYRGKFRLWREGTVRALMEIHEVGAAEAESLMAGWEEQGLTTQAFYRVLQEAVAPRTLVDKSPSYALDPEALLAAEREFDAPYYIHLTRHPYAMIRSFEEYRLAQVLFLQQHSFSARELGELVWTLSHQNTREFLAGVPSHRQSRIRFEDLVRDPSGTLRSLCSELGLEFHEAMANPYQDLERRMVDGVHDVSTPMGDTRLLEHGAIRPEVADRWRDVAHDDFLSELTWRIAERLGYERGFRPRRDDPAATLRERRQAHRRSRLKRGGA